MEGALGEIGGEEVLWCNLCLRGKLNWLDDFKLYPRRFVFHFEKGMKQFIGSIMEKYKDGKFAQPVKGKENYRLTRRGPASISHYLLQTLWKA